MKALMTGLALTLAATGTVVPAKAFDGRASFYEEVRGGRHEGRLSERRVARLVYREGFAEIERIHLARNAYVVEAVRPNGAVFRLALDAYDGRLLSRERIGWSRGHDPRRYGAPRAGIEFRFGF